LKGEVNKGTIYEIHQ